MGPRGHHAQEVQDEKHNRTKQMQIQNEKCSCNKSISISLVQCIVFTTLNGGSCIAD